ncbi:helix-turn-helix domain-containing protein [Mycobacterium sp. C3-094]
MAKLPATQRGKYANQRQKVTAPVVTTATLRKALGITLQDVCDHINGEFDFPKPVERGTISAIENGHRGASAQMLAAIASALGIPVEAIDTQYSPRRSGAVVTQVPA